MTADKRWSENRAVWRGSRLHIHRDSADRPRYITGVVSTDAGYVDVYAQGFGAEKWKFTRLNFITKGRDYSLHIPKLLSQRGIATVARRFVVEVMRGDHA